MIGQSLKRVPAAKPDHSAPQRKNAQEGRFFMAGAAVQNVIVRATAASRGTAARKLSSPNIMAGPVPTLPLMASCPG